MSYCESNEYDYCRGIFFIITVIVQNEDFVSMVSEEISKKKQAIGNLIVKVLTILKLS